MTNRARIFQQPKNAMQSGTAGTQDWVLEFEPAEPRKADPLMGWIGSADTQTQVKLRFETREDAVAYAEKNGIDYEVELPKTRHVRPKAYADNFRFGRRENWTH
ncbi:ETC complex I subunit [Rhodovastum atsumiense]|uniref:ETC complex I subunit n=1 Tax=Rhodovastum atsumiense TaxID=504468 RepID=A0A5M6IZQ4_9PROT|nr:ETC complex I subunit [Rhodovastum atsumiense]KAA5613816.1 ETC complex I subunit [Rhodovastum atsumiense]CAH2601916.1 ETC complex I subunit [Rhodovastum atsumiense]